MYYSRLTDCTRTRACTADLAGEDTSGNEIAMTSPRPVKAAGPNMNLLLGGVVRQDTRMRHNTAALDFYSYTWRHDCCNHELFLNIRGDAWSTASDESAAVLLRGYAAPRSAATLPSQEAFVTELLHEFRNSGTLPVDKVEGSFTVVALDARSGKVKLFRNLVGTGYTYYYQRSDAFLFSNNLPMLLQVIGDTPSVNRDVLPLLFMYRFPIGRPTLFEGIQRLMPGECLQYAAGNLSVVQRQTLADLEEEPISAGEAVERLESTMARVMKDCASIDPRAVVLLSGGVDSSYIQAHWNRVCRDNDSQPISSVVAVDHPMTLGDRMYARSAAEAFGTEHLEVVADEPFGQYMIDTITATGEVLSHAQTAYFYSFAAELRKKRIRTALCGEGADGLFGTDWITMYRRADSLRWLPLWLSQLLRGLATCSGRIWWAEALTLSMIVDNRQDPRHPLNRLGTFAHLPSVQNAFGQNGLVHAFEIRQRLLAQYRVRDDELEQIHAVGLLGESMETASLWNTCFEAQGLSILNPFLDSRVLRYVINLTAAYRYAPGPPKRALRDALLRHAPPDLVYRRKLAFGQPIFEYLMASGQLGSLVDQIADYDFVPHNVLTEGKQSPNWFLYTLLCFDLWHKIHIEKTDISTPSRTS